MRKFLCNIGWHHNSEEIIDSSGGGSFILKHTCKCCGHTHTFMMEFG